MECKGKEVEQGKEFRRKNVNVEQKELQKKRFVCDCR